MPEGTSQQVGTRVEAFMVTDVGLVREHNEDSAYVDPEGQFFIVADGMGGHAAGEVASAIAVETVRDTLEDGRVVLQKFLRKPTEATRREVVGLLQRAVLSAHQLVYQRGMREADKEGMGTTLDVLVVAGGEAFVAHVGDSRTYLIRDGRCNQLTTDHTYAQARVIQGEMTVEEAQVSEYRFVLINAIGVSPDVGVEINHLQLRGEDRLLLCSDGLHDYFLEDEEIATVLSDVAVESSLRTMVEVAKERGGSDNITGVVVHVLDVPDGVPSAVEADSTQPVQAVGQGAAAGGPAPLEFTWNEDEHTETVPPDEADPPAIRVGSANRATQPMRIGQLIDASIRRELEQADTIPPVGAAPLSPDLVAAIATARSLARPAAIDEPETEPRRPPVEGGGGATDSKKRKKRGKKKRKDGEAAAAVDTSADETKELTPVAPASAGSAITGEEPTMEAVVSRDDD